MRTMHDVELGLGETEMLTLEEEAVIRGMTPDELVREAELAAFSFAAEKENRELFDAALDHYTAEMMRRHHPDNG